MLLKDTFYSVSSFNKTENGFLFSIHIDKNHSIFEGHFPGNPVTPGVVQMEIVKELLQVAFEKKVALTSMPSCKFLAILNPEANADIKVEIELKDETEQGFRANITFSDETTGYLKMTAIYQFK